MDLLSRRAFHKGTLMALAAAALPSLGRGQSASQPGRILVGYPPGGTLDQTARRLAEAWRRQGQVYIVENRAGAAGRIASAQLKRERSDGSVVLCTQTSALTIYPHVYRKLAYDAATDFAPVTPVAAAACAFAVSSAVPAAVSSLADYVRWAKASPNNAMYASPAAGSMAHFLGFRFGQAAGLKLQHVAYRGTAPAMQDLLGGQVPSYFGFVGDFLPYMESGKIRILGTAAEQRSRFIRGVPTFVEQGFAGVVGTETYALFVPPQASSAVVSALYDAARAASKDPAVRAGFDQIGMDALTLPPAEFTARIKEEREAWRPVVQASGFTSED
jgi:tripartite-type tricarboxylate transporter receptor subunit TctC